MAHFKNERKKCCINLFTYLITYYFCILAFFQLMFWPLCLKYFFTNFVLGNLINNACFKNNKKAGYKIEYILYCLCLL